MGCGKSKLDAVATGNTIGKKSDVQQSKKSVDAELNKMEISSSSSSRLGSSLSTRDAALVVQVEWDLQQGKEVGDDNDNVDRVDEPEDTTEQPELKTQDMAEQNDDADGKDKEEEEEEELEEEEAGAEEGDQEMCLIGHDSPNHFFSSRKDEEAVEGMVGDGPSEYNSPRHDGKETEFTETMRTEDDDEQVEEKPVAEEENPVEAGNEELHEKSNSITPEEMN